MTCTAFEVPWLRASGAAGGFRSELGITVTDSMWSARTPLVATLPRRKRISRNPVAGSEDRGSVCSAGTAVSPGSLLLWTTIGIRASAVVMMWNEGACRPRRGGRASAAVLLAGWLRAGKPVFVGLGSDRQDRPSLRKSDGDAVGGRGGLCGHCGGDGAGLEAFGDEVDTKRELPHGYRDHDDQGHG